MKTTDRRHLFNTPLLTLLSISSNKKAFWERRWIVHCSSKMEWEKCVFQVWEKKGKEWRKKSGKHCQETCMKKMEFKFLWKCTWFHCAIINHLLVSFISCPCTVEHVIFISASSKVAWFSQLYFGLLSLVEFMQPCIEAESIVTFSNVPWNQYFPCRKFRLQYFQKWS